MRQRPDEIEGQASVREERVACWEPSEGRKGDGKGEGMGSSELKCRSTSLPAVGPELPSSKAEAPPFPVGCGHFYAARTGTIPPLSWHTSPPPLLIQGEGAAAVSFPSSNPGRVPNTISSSDT
jgi:hypothetical protein